MRHALSFFLLKFKKIYIYLEKKKKINNFCNNFYNFDMLILKIKNKNIFKKKIFKKNIKLKGI